MNMGYHYSVAVDQNNPNRVFCNYLEFAVDYSKPLLPNNGSWTLVKNWAYNIVGTKDDQFARLKGVTTLSNNRTYALARRSDFKWEVIELTATGLRFTGVLTPHLGYTLEKNGDMRTAGNLLLGQQPFFKNLPLTGFNGSGNPKYGNEIIIATSPTAITGQDPVSENLGANRYLSNGSIITFSNANYDDGASGNGFHLGILKANKWLAKFSGSTYKQYAGEFPANGDFDIGNGVGYTSDFASAIDNSIFYIYNGEFWKNSQTNKINHYYSNGLFLGQAGVTGPFSYPSDDAAPMMAGNAKTGQIVKVADDYYLYHCDESFHGGVHRWKISGLSTIQEQIVPVVKLGNPPQQASDYVNLMEGLPFASTLKTNTAGWTRNPKDDYNNNYSDRWQVVTNKTTYKVAGADLRITNYPNTGGLTREVARNLGSNSNLINWKISGEVAYIEPEERYGYNYMDVLDGQGKVIVRVNRGGIYPNFSLYANNSTLVNAPNQLSIVSKLQPFSIEVLDTDIIIKYANYPFVTVSKYDNSADIKSPKTLKFSSYSPNTASHVIDIANLKFYSSVTTPSAPTLTADDDANTLSASHALGDAEILVSENGSAFTTYPATINVGNVARPAGYWKFKTKSAPQRNESAVVSSPEFTVATTPNPPTLAADEVANTLTASHALGTLEILVSENGNAFIPYLGTINVGNVARPAGYWKFKTKSAPQRNESAVVGSPEFTVTTTPNAPTLTADDAANTLSASHALGSTEILVSENGNAFTPYAGTINVGNLARPAGYWKFKTKSAPQRNESDVVNSGLFTTALSFLCVAAFVLNFK